MAIRFKRGDPIERAISDLDQQIATVQRQMREASNGSEHAGASSASPARTVTKFVKDMLAPPKRTASSNAQADLLILQVEKDLRIRLAENIFGADDDSLEGVILGALRQRGWSMASFEFQTGGTLDARLTRTGDPTFRGGKVLPTPPGSLIVKAREVR